MPKSSSTLCCLLLALCFIQAASASTTPCRSKGTNEEVLAYQGSCVEGYLQGRTEAVIRYVDRVGTPQVRKQFGWYENGVPTGMHTMLVSSLFLFVYDNNGASQAAFQFPMPGSALWQNVLPAAVEYTRFGDPSLYWAELEKKDGNFFYPAESPRGKERGNIGRLKDILRYGDIYARSTKQATSVGNHALLLYLDSLPVSEPFKSKEQLSVHKLLFPDNSAALIQRLKPQDNEALVYTREGCGMLRVRVASLPQRTQVWLDDSYLRYSWQGECVDGLSLGEGRLLFRDEEERVFLDRSEWHYWGRRTGKGTQVFIPNTTAGSPGWSQDVFSYQGKWYLIQRPAAGPLNPRPEDQNPPTFLGNTPQHQIAYQLLLSDEKTKACGSRKGACLSEASYIGGKIGSDRKITACAQDCSELFQQKTAPVIADFNAVVEQYRAEIDALKVSVAPLVAAAREKRLQDERLMAEMRRAQALAQAQAQAQAKIAAANKAREVRIAERNQVLSKANQARQPVNSPNIDALIKQVLGEKK